MPSHRQTHCRIVLLCVILLGMVSLVSAQHRAPTDWSDWEKYRAQVQHPAAAIKPADLARARQNIERYDWAKNYVARLQKNADYHAELVTPEYLEHMLERTTPGCVGPCPACRAKGLPWHPNGQWSWSSKHPDQLTCRVCKTVFPDDEFPESVVVQSTWDPEQKFSFIGGETFRCFGYTFARPSISGIIRARKVGYVTGQLHTFGLAYALTEDPKHARAAKAVLLRLAEVLPKYLVRAGYGYGEYTDCDPHIAAERISDLPNDELVYPPNKPDRKLYAGYWAASRIGSSGMDGGWVARVTQAYDLTCLAREEGVPVYSEEERIRIERDVLLESSYLAACDPSINNKSVGNRMGAAMVGMCVGHPGLVRFGLDGFKRTVDDWFLPDGGTSESPAYAMMTMGGIRNFGLMLRDYSDPPGYVAPDGTRLDHFDACRDTRYGDCWQDLIWTLQGNLRHAPSADSYRTTSIASSYAELIAVAYPTDEHIAFLKELAGENLAGGSPEQAVFYREPGIDTRDVPAFSLPDVVFPFLAQAYLRTGPTGRDSVALLNASDYGGHHHYDSLDLYYWKDGRELLSDLGYLWDHPDSGKTRRTFAHNLVMLDGANQRARGRAGSFHIFSITPRVKVMEASSRAYDKASVYRRTCVQIDHGEAGSYLVDIFRADGGAKRQYVFHGPGNDYEVEGLEFGAFQQAERKAPFALRFQLPQVSEILVDDVEIRRVLPDGKEGPNLAPDPSASEGAEGEGPPGWGYYGGDGKGDSSIASPGRTDDHCVRCRALEPHANGRMNVALLVGESDGYRGEKAIVGTLGASYKVRFWLKGNADRVNVGVVAWPNDPASAGDRSHIGVRNLQATEDWKQYEATFTLLGSALPLDNKRQASGEAPWRITWQVGEDYTFTALSPGNENEAVILGDGWGQRDHRNSDRGATLPYIVRASEGPGVGAVTRPRPGPTVGASEGPRLSTFISVFEGAPTDKSLVKGVRRLELPEGAPADAVAVEVETSRGADVIVSMLQPDLTTVQTSLGELSTDARLACILGTENEPAAACLVGGKTLKIGGTSLECPQASYGGNVLDVASEPGESYFVLNGELPEDSGLIGHTLFVQDGDIRRAYPIREVRTVGGKLRAYTKINNVGFEARPGETWEFFPSAAWERR